MSVTMGLRISAKPDRFMEATSQHRDVLTSISDKAKEAGAIHHRFYGSADGDAVLVVDEWPDQQSFFGFFESQGSNIGQLMEAAGATGQPHPEFWQELDTPDKF